MVEVKCFAVMKKFISPMRLVRIQTLINALPKNSPQDCFYLRFFANARNLARSPSSPATSTVLCKKIKTGHIFYCDLYGRGDRTWTCGILVPNQALYQTELHLEMLFNNNSLIIIYHIFGFVNIIFAFYSKLIQIFWKSP